MAFNPFGGKRLRGLQLCVRVLAALLLGMLFTGCTKRAPAVAQQQAQLVERSCAYSLPERNRLRCYDYFTGAGRTGFRLPVVVIRGREASVEAPLVYLPGGPGATHVTHSSSVAYWLAWLDSVTTTRDLVLFELRGAEPGSPSWHCGNYEEISNSVLRQNLSVVEEAEIVYPVLTRCLRSFDARLRKTLGADREFRGTELLATTHYANDVSNILRELQRDSWSLLASSYGTRLAMTIAGRETRIAQVILDSPYPPGTGDLVDALSVWAKAFAQLFKQYETQGLQANYWQAVDKLKQQPVRVSVENWDTGADVSWQLTDFRLSLVLYHAMYSNALYQQIPAAITGLLEGQTAPMQPLLESFYNNAFDRYFNAMVFFVTECNDNSLSSEAAFQQQLQKMPQWAAYFQGDWLLNACRLPVFAKRDLVLKPHSWPQPTLIAQGALDPITNQDYAAITHALAEQAQLLTIADLSHSEFIDSACGRQLIGQFLREPAALIDFAVQYETCARASRAGGQN